jgi:FMN hydrolase / 5-amino-6-(5-phospho-D-ribitylamino)uracil phosphatase
MRSLRVICFDLDDTLWNLAPVIEHAEQLLYLWLDEYYPRVTAAYSPADLSRLRMLAASRWPELQHDLSELRLRTLRQIAEATGYDEQMVAGAYAVFFDARNNVQLYDDVVPVLQQLSASYRLIALSNGNADLRRIGIADLFDSVYSARDLGVAKPDSRFFMSAAERCNAEPHEMLHVGDHPENDIAAARYIGMKTVWINRAGVKWPLPDTQPHYEIKNLTQLQQLLQL